MSTHSRPRQIRLILDALEDRLVPTGGLSLNQNYVIQLYQDVLARAADPAGISYWSASLDQGSTRADVAGQLTRSTEALSRELDNFYEHYLRRHTDAGGTAAFMPLLAAAEENVVQARLLGSQEYSSMHHADD